MHTTQVLPPLLTLKFLISGRLFRLRVIALEGDKNLASESVLKLLSLKDLHAAEIILNKCGPTNELFMNTPMSTALL